MAREVIADLSGHAGMIIVMRALLGLLLLKAAMSFAVIETYTFNEVSDQKRYEILIEELRCPKCQNQNLSGSNSPIAKDLRKQVYRMIEAGDNNQVITQFMVKRYGNFVRYEPPLDMNTLLLWGLPFLLLLIGLLVAFYLQKKTDENYSERLTPEEGRRLAELLNSDT